MQQNVWHTAKWGTWGWAETIVKLIALGAGLVAFASALSADGFRLGDNPRLAAVILLVLLTLAAIAQLAIRAQQRETISVIFAVLNLLGHLGLLFALLRVPDQTALPLIFGILYLFGQLIKLQFLRVTGYTEGGANTSGMLRVTGAVAAAYALFVILLLL